MKKIINDILKMLLAIVQSIYIFDEENSAAKTAFYATVGAAVLAGAMYGLDTPTEKPIKEEPQLSEPKKQLSEAEKTKLINKFKGIAIHLLLYQGRDNDEDRDKYILRKKGLSNEDAEDTAKEIQDIAIQITKLKKYLITWASMARRSSISKRKKGILKTILFYNDNIVPIRKYLTSNGLDLERYYDFERKFTGGWEHDYDTDYDL